MKGVDRATRASRNIFSPPRSQTLFGNANIFATLLPRTPNKVREQNTSHPPACHVERSETSLLVSNRSARRNGQRSFALLRMTGLDVAGLQQSGPHYPSFTKYFPGSCFTIRFSSSRMSVDDTVPSGSCAL